MFHWETCLCIQKLMQKINLVFIDDEEYLYHPGFIAKDINLMLMDKLNGPIKAKVKIRYKDEGSDAIIRANR